MSRYRIWWRSTSGCLNLRYQASHKKSKCQSLLNQDIKWFGDQKLEIDYTVWCIPSHNLLRVNAKTRSSVTTLMKSKRDEVATITLCKIKLKKYILYLILSICMPLYQEGCYIDYQQSVMLNKSLNTQVRWVKHNGHTHYISHWTRKTRMVRFPKPEGPVWADELQLLVFKYRMFWFPKLDVPVFTG
jgi:hypothetical protein